MTSHSWVLHALCLHNTSTTTVGESIRGLSVLRDAFMGSRQPLCSPVPSLPLSFHLRGPMGEATVASHVFSLTNDKVAASASMNNAGWRGSNSTLSYVNLTSRRQRGESYREGVTPIFSWTVMSSLRQLVSCILWCKCVKREATYCGLLTYIQESKDTYLMLKVAC